MRDEEDLARWCVLELDPTDEVLRALVGTAEWSSGNETVTGDSLDNKIDEETYSRVWGDWRGRERDFFARCADLVSPLSWAEVMAIGGPRVRAYAELTRQAYRRLLSDDVPPALNVGPIQLVQVRDGVARVNSYDAYDPLDVPKAIMELLFYFDGLRPRTPSSRSRKSAACAWNPSCFARWSISDCSSPRVLRPHWLDQARASTSAISRSSIARARRRCGAGPREISSAGPPSATCDSR